MLGGHSDSGFSTHTAAAQRRIHTGLPPHEQLDDRLPILVMSATRSMDEPRKQAPKTLVGILLNCDYFEPFRTRGAP